MDQNYEMQWKSVDTVENNSVGFPAFLFSHLQEKNMKHAGSL